MGRFIGKVIKGILFVAIGIFLFGYISMLLWNALIPSLFHGPVLTYWEMIGILILSKILFGGHGGCHRGGYRRHRRWGKGGRGNANMWDFVMWDKYASMSPEEREKMKEDWKSMGSSECGPRGAGMWDVAMWDKMAAMSPEERKKAKEEWKAQFKGWGGH